jgi:hypothetical protein
MEQQVYVIRDVVPGGQRKRARTPGVASANAGDRTNSSLDLRFGVDIVEVPVSQWANTQPMDRKLPSDR